MPNIISKHDVFVCHASEDKEEIATPLADELRQYRLDVWYDDFTLTAGDDLEIKINDGLKKSRYGIVILSEKFFEKLSAKSSKKGWLKKELGALLTKEKNGQKVILPVLHKLTPEQVKAHSSVLANKHALRSSDGIPKVAENLIRVIDDGVYLDKPDTISIGESLIANNPLEMISQRAEERDNYWEITLKFNVKNNILYYPTLMVVFYTFDSVSPAKKRYPNAKKEDAQKVEFVERRLLITDVGEESYGYIWEGFDRGHQWINGIVVFRRNNLMVRIEHLIPYVEGASPIDMAEQYAKLVDSRIVSKMKEKIQESNHE